MKVANTQPLRVYVIVMISSQWGTQDRVKYLYLVGSGGAVETT